LARELKAFGVDMDDNSGRTGLSAARAARANGQRVENGSMVGAAIGAGTVELSGGESCVPRVGDLPIRAVPIIPAHLSMAAARKIAELKQATVLFVEREGRLMGTLDQQALVEAPDDAKVADCLRSIELCLGPTTTAQRAQELFARTHTTALPVAAGAFLLGAVSRADVERALRSRRQPKRRESFTSVRATA
jgi:CBS domain-containing protein